MIIKLCAMTRSPPGLAAASFATATLLNPATTRSALRTVNLCSTRFSANTQPKQPAS